MDRPPPSPPQRRTAGVEKPKALHDRRTRNRHRLQAYADASDAGSRLHWRNLLVEDNLPLVYSIAGRQGAEPGLGFDDLAQVGSLGLIRAVEAFDPGRNVSFSSFAVPYIQGAMRRERRDRQPMLRPPRPLWDLHQQVLSLQEARRRQGLEPLDTPALAERLACDPQRLEEALRVRSTAQVRSLDAPLGPGAGTDEAATCLLDLLAAPASGGQEQETATGGDARGAEREWLQRQLAALDPRERQLVEGRIQVGCTWVELGRQLGMAPRQAQRRCTAALARLQEAALAWRERRGPR